jgi:hypothetical protein
MPATGLPCNPSELRQLAASGRTMGSIAMHFCVTVGTIRKWGREHGVKFQHGGAGKRADPTPEEIAERAAECRARHMAARLRETPEETERRLAMSA